jgi:NADH-quinone oxidoreductase subunit E
METKAAVNLTSQQLTEIDAWVAKYPASQQQSAIIPALKLVQAQNEGSLTQALIDAVADYLDMPRIAAYEVVSFYTMFNLKPVGRFVINVCTNVSCMLCGSEAILARLEQRLGIKAGETTRDGKFTLHEERECLAACVDAPMLEINKRCYNCLTPEKVDDLLAEYENK